ncbi:hypothetical protein JCM10914A_44930 [Paenibacillus sp. JCM 10914]|uniref:hypothetical protein n=1 Tax=Paenibacillus sp. JCM 10914 TaxID=1236974 RepID=UPI0003CC634A|nr:hypothetical protein [Paenibacillus sp. JCM 10914]GAE09193.1 hypothetical protein JCM10914_5542 [Paenibacillus sp. JCM 10914]
MSQSVQKRRKKRSTLNKATAKQLVLVAGILAFIASAIGLYIAYEELSSDEDLEEIII